MMTRATLMVTLAVFGTASLARAQEFTVDPALAKEGMKVFKGKACNGCHSIGKGKLAGPDLAGVTTRRTNDWLKAWLKDPKGLVATDETAQAMVKEFNNTMMPDFKLKDPEIEAVIHYMASESAKVKK